MLIHNYQALVNSLRERENIIQKEFDRHNARLRRHHSDLEGCNKDLHQLADDQVKLTEYMEGFEEKACHCGSNSNCLSDMSYGEPPVAGSSGLSFPSGKSPVPIPVPPPSAPVPAADVPVPSSGLSSSDKENSSVRSFQSAQQAVGELVEIVEADPEVDDEEAQALLDAMDAEVRSCLYQCCKSKKHPHCFAPFPKGWKADRACQQRQTFHPQLEVNRERFVRTQNLREGLDGDMDVESEHSGSSSGE